MTVIGARWSLLAALVVLAPIAGSAQEPDLERGRELAVRWCSDCHVVSPDGPGGDAGPAFESLARGRSDEGLRAWVAEPHPPMPELDISARAVDEISAYIRSLGACKLSC
ncbi:cytochrome c [Limibaculum sp. M0105]|uniref:Cytochrome c n=1 Tax=Thermohalobaculum xanthum TaxID=2753746 RepID=A0A8J7M610_9RHOB|nr:cytochrome c [Thermohalobaculum xanthum]MBK0398845.1 cytochrome c [Thermohalobaculum xanthum]